MNSEPLRALLQHRIEQAHETLREATILQEAAAYRGVINRAYYAMFYALLALLATRNFGTSKHSGAIGLFDREFVKTGVFPIELSRALHLAFDRRQSSDYGEWSVLETNEAKMTLSDAQHFVAAVETYLREQGFM
jgi:uncharacterized protein (UPF0332 family)